MSACRLTVEAAIPVLPESLQLFHPQTSGMIPQTAAYCPKGGSHRNLKYKFTLPATSLAPTRAASSPGCRTVHWTIPFCLVFAAPVLQQDFSISGTAKKPLK